MSKLRTRPPETWDYDESQIEIIARDATGQPVPLVTATQAAALLNTSRQAIMQRFQRGTLHPIRVYLPGKPILLCVARAEVESKIK